MAPRSLASRGLGHWEPSGDQKSERPGGHFEATSTLQSPLSPYGLPREHPERSSERKTLEGRRTASSPCLNLSIAHFVLNKISIPATAYTALPSLTPAALSHTWCQFPLFTALRLLGQFFSSFLWPGFCTRSPLSAWTTLPPLRLSCLCSFNLCLFTS